MSASSSGNKRPDKVDKQALVKSINSMTEVEDDVLSRARNCLKESMTEFVEKKIGMMFKIVSYYSDFMKSYEAKTKADLDRTVQKLYRHSEVSEAVDAWYDVEQEWDDLLAGVDKNLDQGDNNLMNTGEMGPVDVPLDELSAAGGRVVLISFGVLKGAKKWLEDTGYPFEMLLDEDRKIYKAFSLKKSVLKVWSIGSLLYYAEHLVAGKELPAPYKDIEDDPHQMGGDFIMDKSGKMQLMYRSKTARDRPTVDELLKLLKDMQD